MKGLKKTDLNVLVIGCGSIGTRHIHNLAKLGIKKINICDVNKNNVKKVSKKFKVKEFFDVRLALESKPDLTFICTYPNSHIELANMCIRANSNIFIEKPLSSNINNVEKMLKLAKNKKIQVAVGYNLRFDKGLNLIKEKLKRNEIGNPLSIFSYWGQNIKLWKPGTDYKNHYILKKGSGIILDDSHEYDYIRWLFGSEVESVYCQTKKLKNIKTETESIATINMKLKKGPMASLVIDYVRPNYEQGCQIIGEKGDIKWSYELKKSAWKDYSLIANSKVNTSKLNKKKKINSNYVKVNDMYIDEVENVINSVLENKKPKIDGWDALKTLKIGVALLESASKDKIIKL
jgi:predicted dehydrogenase|tara:strand:- start:4159 stop:5199 length:1041 start_codon:yes stop_codon:yes gene_type:complete